MNHQTAITQSIEATAADLMDISDNAETRYASAEQNELDNHIDAHRVDGSETHSLYECCEICKVYGCEAFEWNDGAGAVEAEYEVWTESAYERRNDAIAFDETERDRTDGGY